VIKERKHQIAPVWPIKGEPDFGNFFHNERFLIDFIITQKTLKSNSVKSLIFKAFYATKTIDNILDS